MACNDWLKRIFREKENEDPLDNVYKRLKSAHDYDSVDFSYEASDEEGAILNVFDMRISFLP